MLGHFVKACLLKIEEAQFRHNKKVMSTNGIDDFLEFKLEVGLFNGLEEAATIIKNLYKGNPEGIEKSNTER